MSHKDLIIRAHELGSELKDMNEEGWAADLIIEMANALESLEPKTLTGGKETLEKYIAGYKDVCPHCGKAPKVDYGGYDNDYAQRRGHNLRGEPTDDNQT